MEENASSVTAEELATWLTPRQALTIVEDAFSNIGIAARMISGRLKGGLIRAGAKSSSWDGSASLSSMVLIPAHYWSHLSMGGSADWWDTGDVRFFFPRNKNRNRSLTGRYFGIRFEPSGVRAIIADLPMEPALQPTPAAIQNQPPAPPVPPASIPVVVSAAHKGGRPPKEWWDDLWVEICRQLFVGDLTPEKQAVIERAMLDWASEHGHDVSESTVRKAARKLFAVLQEEGKN